MRPPDIDETITAIRRGVASMQSAQIVELVSVGAKGDVIEVRFRDRRDPEGRVFRGRARLTGPTEEEITMGDVPGPEEWAEYNVILPMIEALVTTATQQAPDDWIDLPRV